MNKLVLSAFALGVLGFTSCKKEYTCTCTSTGQGYSGTASITYVAKKKDAEKTCNGYEETADGVTTTCELK
jgi:hypothetical protein